MRRASRGKFLAVLAVAAAGAGCPPRNVEPPKPKPNPEERRIGPTPPRVDVPGPITERRMKARVDPAALPEGARAVFPAYDGDPFVVTLPVRLRDKLSSREVMAETVSPVLRAVGFAPGEKGVRLPPEAGLPQPVGKFDGLAQAVAAEYAANPKMMRKRTQQMIDVFLGRAKPDEELNKAIEAGEGMNFAQFVAGIERLGIHYPFFQVDHEIPIEHTALVAARWQGQGITTLWGSVFSEYTVTNTQRLDPQEAVKAAVEEVDKLEDVDEVFPRALEGPFLVLLPYTTLADGKTDMRLSYRILVRFSFAGQTGPGLVWIDADTGKINKFVTFLESAVSAQGMAYNRDPGIGTTTPFFQVESSSGGQYTLQLAGFSNRPDYQGDGVAGFNALDVSISNAGGGSSATFAQFNQAPINNVAQALCGSGTNKGFQQVNFFAHLHRQYSLVSSQGIFTPFPTSSFNPLIESLSAGCNAWAGLNFGACAGYYDANCPNAADGTNGSNNWLNTAHDSTWIAHELGHSITPRLTNARPSNWCGTPPCAIPVGWGNFHDLCDAWSAHFENTNCWSGWFAKNVNGAGGGLNCASHDEDGWAPRLHQVTSPFNPGAPGDHFPEHRMAGHTGPYAEMQVGAAALWEVRWGMRSKCRPSGMPQYGVRFQRALKETGFLGFSPANTDLGSFQSLFDLEAKLTDQWVTSGSPGGPPGFAHNGPASTNKVTAGFARAGVFLIPYQCLDGDPGTLDGFACPNVDLGADAAVDVDDNDTADDLTLNGASLPEVDYLRQGGPAPTFHVWTGPRYRLDGAGGAASLNNPAPCNSKFQVDVANDPSFPGATTIQSPWINVDRDPTTAASPECYGTWTPSAAEWTTLQAGGSRVYFRARTRDPSDQNERISTSPGAGVWTAPPPYAVITPDGKPDY